MEDEGSGAQEGNEEHLVLRVMEVMAEMSYGQCMEALKAVEWNVERAIERLLESPPPASSQMQHHSRAALPEAQSNVEGVRPTTTKAKKPAGKQPNPDPFAYASVKVSKPPTQPTTTSSVLPTPAPPPPAPARRGGGGVGGGAPGGADHRHPRSGLP